MLWLVLKMHVLFLLKSPVHSPCKPVHYVLVYKYTHAYWYMCSEPEGCTEGAVRLSGGDIEQEGIPQVCVNGVWGSICDSGLSSTDGQVICRELGYHDIGIILLLTMQNRLWVAAFPKMTVCPFCLQKFQCFIPPPTLEMEKVQLFGVNCHVVDWRVPSHSVPGYSILISSALEMRLQESSVEMVCANCY